ncbi:hypothetical protein Y024_5680 [Burkholderia pseudomallei TSV44]|nr:hypothetical protein Y024_5680 [Burkholderia pseudomallei TSV44]
MNGTPNKPMHGRSPAKVARQAMISPRRAHVRPIARRRALRLAIDGRSMPNFSTFEPDYFLGQGHRGNVGAIDPRSARP